jgi:hypothetical protein
MARKSRAGTSKANSTLSGSGVNLDRGTDLKKKKKPRRTKRLTKKQVEYFVRNLRTLDTSIMHAFVIKDVECRGLSQFSCYKDRYKLWCAWKTSTKLEDLLAHLSRVFVDLFQQHRTGSDPFARFLISWYESLGKLACYKLNDNTASDLWLQLSEGQAITITDEDRSALVFLVGASCYTFIRKQVSTIVIIIHVIVLCN